MDNAVCETESLGLLAQAIVRICVKYGVWSTYRANPRGVIDRHEKFTQSEYPNILST